MIIRLYSMSFGKTGSIIHWMLLLFEFEWKRIFHLWLFYYEDEPMLFVMKPFDSQVQQMNNFMSWQYLPMSNAYFCLSIQRSSRNSSVLGVLGVMTLWYEVWQQGLYIYILRIFFSNPRLKKFLMKLMCVKNFITNYNYYC